MFISNATENPDENQQQNKESLGPSLPENAKKKGCKVMKPRYDIEKTYFKNWHIAFTL